MPYKRKTFKRKNGNGGAKLSKRQKQSVKRLIGKEQELKTADSGFVATSIDVPGVISGPFFPVGQGDGDHQRDGDQIKLHEVDCRLQVRGFDSQNFVRLIIFRWWADSAVDPPTAGFILETPLGVNPWNQPINRNSLDSGVLQIMYDKTLSMTVSGSSGCWSRRIRFFQKNLGKKIQTFNAPALTSGRGHFYIYGLSDSIAVNHPTMLLNARIMYTDS